MAPLGLARDDAWHVLRLVDAYTIGQAMTVASLERVREVHGEFVADVPDLPDAFVVGLETVLDGVEHRFNRR